MEAIFCELLKNGKRPSIFNRSSNQSDLKKTRKVNPTAACGANRINNKLKKQTSNNKLKNVNSNNVSGYKKSK